MLQTLKCKLTIICVLSTTLIVTIITLVALNFSKNQLTARRQLNLQNTLLSVVQQLQHGGLSYSWLAQVEMNNETVISIYTDNAALSFPGSYIIGSEREEILKSACKPLTYDYSIDELPVSFDIYQNNKHYLILYTLTEYKNIEYNVLLVQDLKHSDEQILFMRIFFGLLIINGSILLSLFSFWFVSKAIKPIEISQKEQTDFIAAASHEMRSPLAVIQASIDNLLENESFQEERYLHTINKECSKLTRFVNDLLFLANTDTGRWRIDLKPTEMDTILLELYDSFIPLVSQRNHSLDIELPDSMQPGIMIDPERISQAVSILINNALAYTPETTKITLSLINEKNIIKIIVSDNGPGISENDKKNIFKRFYRVDAARHNTQHYGLGLSIAFEIIKQHNGKLSVYDTPGGGATFSIILPITVM